MKDVWFGNYCASQLLCATICHGTVLQVKQSLVGNAHIGIGNEQSLTAAVRNNGLACVMLFGLLWHTLV